MPLEAATMAKKVPAMPVVDEITTSQSRTVAGRSGIAAGRKRQACCLKRHRWQK
jgi:hypothetical protein